MSAKRSALPRITLAVVGSMAALALQAATCQSEVHQVPQALVGVWQEFTITPTGLVLEGELRSELTAAGCAYVQSFKSPDGQFSFRSLGHVDAEQGNWIEYFVLSNGKTATYRWETVDDGILLHRVAPEAGQFRLRITQIQPDSYVVIEERRPADSDQWHPGERTLTRRVSADAQEPATDE